MENSDIKISFILPLFNCEKFVERCLISIYNQDISKQEYEIIVIDDKSTDHSLEVVCKLKSKISNLRIVKHMENKGLGATRNTGLKNAVGKYIWYVDTDDFISGNCLNEILYLLEENHLDVLGFNFYRESNARVFEKDKVNPKKTILPLSGVNYLEKYYRPDVMSSCSRVYSRSYLIKNHFVFEEGVFWEDADYVLKSIYFAEKFMFIPKHFYYYCYNNQSISRKNDPNKIVDLLKLATRKYEFACSISEKILSSLVVTDAVWNTNAIKKIVTFNLKDRLRFYEDVDNISDIKSLVLLNNSIIVHFLFFHPKSVNILLVFISPVLKFIKRTK